jgi:hypothetical protein
MKLLKKLLPFLAIFSLVFFFVRASDEYNTRILVADLGGTPWLYASVSTIFGVIAAFAIQKEWEEWNGLVDAVQGENDGLEKLYLWSTGFPANLKDKIQGNIKNYLKVMIRDGWEYSHKGKRSEEIEATIASLNASIYEIFSEDPRLMPTAFFLFSNILANRSKRLQFSARHMPPLLKNTLQFAAFLLIGLSIFIGVKNIWLAYMFTASVASLAYAIFLVLRDLDDPLTPGDWHITTKDYKELLAKIEA